MRSDLRRWYLCVLGSYVPRNGRNLISMRLNGVYQDAA